MEPVPPLELAKGLSGAADDHALDGEENGVRGHIGSDKSNQTIPLPVSSFVTLLLSLVVHRYWR